MGYASYKDMIQWFMHGGIIPEEMRAMYGKGDWSDGICPYCGAKGVGSWHEEGRCNPPMENWEKAFHRAREEYRELEREMFRTMEKGFTIKDSGERQQFDGGMVRDTDEGKVDYTLALDGPMFQRYAEHLTKGAQKYEKRNWMKANDAAALERFRASALRHLLQWFRGDTDEDHAAAVIFNLNGAEYVRERIRQQQEAERNRPEGFYP
jgi:hypothetical protein